MYVETVPNRNSRPAVLLRGGWREGRRVRKRTLANLTSWPPAKVALLRRVLRDEPLAAPDDAFAVERSLPHGHVEVVLEAMRRLGLPALLDRRRSPRRDRALALVAERVLRPASKLATARLLDDSTLAGEPGLGAVDEDALYEATALRHHAIRKLAEGGTFQPSLFDERGLAEVASDDYPGERLVVCRNRLLAERRRSKREELLAATEAGFDLQRSASADCRA